MDQIPIAGYRTINKNFTVHEIIPSGSHFHVWDRTVNDMVLHFVKGTQDALVDANTHSTWNMDGLCMEGILKGSRLRSVQACQEFWHSWQHFHRNTTKY